MAERQVPARLGFGTSAYSLLQQQLISVRSRLDRQVASLIRMNELSDHLLHGRTDRGVAATFADAIVDVLDVGVGGIWLSPECAVDPSYAICGLPAAGPRWSAVGDALARRLAAAGSARAVRLDALPGPGLAGGLPAGDLPAGDVLADAGLVDALACRSVGRDSRCTAVLLAANTTAIAGIAEPVSDDTTEMLTLLAQKCAAHLDARADHRLIEDQMALLRASEERLALVLRGTNDGWWDWDLVRGTCLVSARWRQMLGRPDAESEVRDRFWFDRVHPADRTGFDTVLEQAFVGESGWVETEVRLRKDCGEYLPVLLRGMVARDQQGTPTRFAGSALDLTERKAHEARVRQLAFYDPLTDLPNRRLLLERLHRAMLAGDSTGEITAVLMLDLDRFKALNDTHGHAAGDALLRTVADRLLRVVRSTDTVARLSGDEFVVLLESLGPDPRAAVDVARRIGDTLLGVVSEPVITDVGVLQHSCSIGIALTTQPGTTQPGLSVDTLLKRADVALYEAKDSGRNAVQVFRPDMQERIDRRAALEVRLRGAIDAGEFAVAYQAQVDVRGHLVGAEALLRWFPPGAEPIPPAEFIPVAEDSGLVHPLGDWVLDEVLAQLVRWGGRVPAGFRVAINLSAPEFLHPDFSERVLAGLARAGLPATVLRLELTEDTVLTDLGLAAERMDSLRRHGLEFSLDDFGTGYSSLNYLRRLPVSEVKIDRSYVARLHENGHDAAILRAVVTLCASLGLRVVAEGVETPDQWRHLVDEGCAWLQGYLIGRPALAPPDPRALLAPGFVPTLGRGLAS